MANGAAIMKANVNQRIIIKEAHISWPGWLNGSLSANVTQ